jgi:hypothetical protein
MGVSRGKLIRITNDESSRWILNGCYSNIIYINKYNATSRGVMTRCTNSLGRMFWTHASVLDRFMKNCQETELIRQRTQRARHADKAFFNSTHLPTEFQTSRSQVVGSAASIVDRSLCYFLQTLRIPPCWIISKSGRLGGRGEAACIQTVWFISLPKIFLAKFLAPINI